MRQTCLDILMGELRLDECTGQEGYFTAILLTIFKPHFLSEELKRHVDLELFITIYYIHANCTTTTIPVQEVSG